MRHGFPARLVTILVFLSVSVSALAQGQKKEEWTWKDREGKTRTRAELEKILGEHNLWLESAGARGTRAGLSYVNLHHANLNHAVLRDADLNGANLRRAVLTDADLTGANLRSADLRGANLIHAEVGSADLVNARLGGADLTGTDLRGTNLNGAEVMDVELKDADFGGANLQGATFEPKSNPETRGIAAARHLELLTYEENPDALVQLRKQFQENGFRTQERKITYAMKRRETQLSWEACTSRKLPDDKTRAILWSSDGNMANCGAFILNRAFFDLTCQYGMSPGRPLVLGLILWFICSCLYFACIHTTGKAGLRRVCSQGLETDPTAHKRVEEIRPREMMNRELRRRIPEFIWREWLVFRTSMFFSLMCAFNIGFRDIHFGRWLRLLTREEFDIKAVGWARVIAGWQSLISVYFIALWVLTHFGRPFG